MPADTLLERLRAALAPRYAVEAEIAAGGMGRVYRARDTHLERLVALKVLHPEHVTALAVERFRREGRMLARLRDPNVLSVHDADERDGLHYLIMDFADGPTVAQRLAAGPLDPAEVRELAHGLLAGLGAAHQRGIVHRDVKPSNVFLHEGRVVVGDFGIASSVALHDQSDPSLTEPGTRIGTPSYMAPEQSAGMPATTESDVYSAGLVLYEACTGNRWPALRDPAAADWKGVPTGIRPALQKALAFAPKDRWIDARAFHSALAQPPWPRLPLLAGATGALLLGVIGWLVYPSPALKPATRADLAIVPFHGRDSAFAANLSKFTAADLGWFPRWTFRRVDAREVAAGAAQPNARWWFDGDMQSRDGHPTLVLSVYDSTGMTLKQTEVPGDTAAIREWAKAIADSVVATAFPMRLAEFRDAMSGSRGDFRANKLMIDGFDAFAAGDWDTAESLLRDAIRRDPTLVQAVWELDLQRKWRREEISDADRRRLHDVRGQLPDPYADLLLTELEPNLRRRLDNYAAIVEGFPRSGRARFLYLNEAFHRGALTGMPLDSALRLMRDAIAQDPYVEHVTIYDQMVWGYIHLGNRVMADSSRAERAALVRRFGRPDAVGSLLSLVYDVRFRPRIGALKSRLAAWHYRRNPRDLVDYLRFGVTFDAPQLQVRLGSVVAAADDRAVRATGRVAEAMALLQLGRAREGLTRLDSATALLASPEARLHALTWRVVPNALGVPLVSADQAEQARRSLARMAAAGDGALANQAAWALAVDAYLRGDTAAGLRWRTRMDSIDTGSAGATYLAAIVRALASAARGEPDTALVLTDTLFIDDAGGLLGGPFARSVLHLQRGHWARALDLPADAEAAWLFHENSHLRGWPRGETQAGEVDAVLSVYARLLRAELAIDQGRRDDGCRMLKRVGGLWAGADPAFDALRGRVRRAAAACG